MAAVRVGNRSMTPEAIAMQAEVNAIEAQPQMKMRKPTTEEYEAMKAKNDEEQQKWEQHEKEMAMRRKEEEKERRSKMTPEELASNNARLANREAAIAMKHQRGIAKKMEYNRAMNNRQYAMSTEKVGKRPEQAYNRAMNNRQYAMSTEKTKKVAKRPEQAVMSRDYSGEGEWSTQKRAVANQKRAVANQKSYDANNGEGGWGVMRMIPAKKSKTYSGNVNMGVAGMGMPAGVGQGVSVGEMKQGPTAGPPMDITPLVTALSTINNTLIGSLASIESRAKKNDINPALVNMNDFLSQINASLPMPTQGGGPAMGAASQKMKTKQTGKKKSTSKSKSTPKTAASAGTPPLAAEVPGTIGGVITVLSQINTTLQTSLAAIETRLTKNDINPALETMNDYLSQINDSIPMPAEGGGTRRSRVKKRKQTLRHRRA